MASIVKRKKKYSVVYTYTDENGNKRQKWETFETIFWMSICQSMV